MDTTFLVDLIRGDPGARALLESAESGSEAVRVPAPAVAKLWEALERSRHPPREAERVREVLASAPEVAFTVEHAVRTGRILGTLAREGLAVDPMDAMVAAVAVEEDEALVTRNRELDRVVGLRIRPY